MMNNYFYPTIGLVILIIALLGLFHKSSNTSSGATNANTNANNNTSSSASVEKGMKVAGKFFGGLWSLFGFLFITLLKLAVFGGFIYGVYLILTSDAVTAVRDGSSWNHSKSSVQSKSRIKGVLIVDEYILPSYNGTLVFTAEANTTYRVKVTGCGSKRSLNTKKYGKYTMNFCSSGKYPSSSEGYVKTTHDLFDEFEKKFRFKNEYVDKAVLVVVKNNKKSFKVVGKSLTTLRFDNNETGTVSLSLNGVNETANPISGKGWHVVVTEM